MKTPNTKHHVQCADVAVVYALNATLPGIPVADGKLPTDIQWMPPGRHTITPLVNGEPKTITVNVDQAAAARVSAALREMRRKAADGEGDLPFFDFDHADAEASGHPVEFYWAGEDPRNGGIRAKVEWTDEGGAAVVGRRFRRFSPAFGLATDGSITLSGVNVGGLVNKAAFQRISPIWSRNGGDQSSQHQTSTKPTNMAKTVEEQLADLTTAVAKLTDQVTAIAAKAGTPDPKIVVLETKLAGIETAQQVQAKAGAKAKVEAAVKLGKIPAQNKELIEQWENLLVVDAKNEALLDALPVNPALARIVASGAGAGTSTATTEHAFVAKAKEYAKANNITDLADAQAKFAGTPEGKDLYAEYRETVAPKK